MSAVFCLQVGVPTRGSVLYAGIARAVWHGRKESCTRQHGTFLVLDRVGPRECGALSSVEWEVSAIERRVRITGTSQEAASGVGDGSSLNVPMDAFAWDAVEEESARLGVSVEELVAFAVLYYLADVDSGRVARRITGSPYRDGSGESEI